MDDIIYRVEDLARKRIAQEIHDSLQNTLISSLLNFESVKKEIEKLSPTSKKRFLQGFEFLTAGINETRVITNLHMPQSLIDYSFSEAIQNLVDGLLVNIEIDYVDKLNQYKFKEDQEINLYRIIQEALNNIIRHSRATKAVITMIDAGDSIQLLIKDNGVGFEGNTKKFGIGLVSMKERAQHVGASFEIISKKKCGTEIKIKINKETND